MTMAMSKDNAKTPSKVFSLKAAPTDRKKPAGRISPAHDCKYFTGSLDSGNLNSPRPSGSVLLYAIQPDTHEVASYLLAIIVFSGLRYAISACDHTTIG